MSYKIEHVEKLKYEISVTVEADYISQYIDSTIKKESANIKLKGFRPGKIPNQVIKQVLGKDLYRNISAEVMREKLFEIIEKEKINMAGYPELKPEPLVDKQDFNFKIIYEDYPEIELPDFNSIDIEDISCELIKEDVDDALNKIREQYAKFEKVDRPSKKGDRLLLDFKGFLDDEPFEGGAAENQTIKIGDGAVIPDLENGLIGLKKGETKKIPVKFPDNYGSEKLAGKDTVFEVNIHEVEESSLPELNDEFAQQLGIKDGVEKLESTITMQINREITNNVNRIKKDIAFDAVSNNVEFDIPDSLIKIEAQGLKDQMLNWMKQQNAKRSQASVNVPKDIPIDSFLSEAKDRVKIGLVVREIIKQKELSTTEQEVDEYIREIGADYEDPEMFLEHYKKNQEEYRKISDACLEDKTVNTVYDACNKSETKLSYKELLGYKSKKQQEKLAEAKKDYEQSEKNEENEQ